MRVGIDVLSVGDVIVATMNNSYPKDLSQLTSRQLADLAWELKGTPEVQPIYWEISRRPAKSSVKLDDPEWDA